MTARVDGSGRRAGYRSVHRPADTEEVAQIELLYRKISKLAIDTESMGAVRCHP